MCDLGMAPGGIFEGFLSSGFCSSWEAGCCSVIGTTLTHHDGLEFVDCQQSWVAGAQDVLGPWSLNVRCSWRRGGRGWQGGVEIGQVVLLLASDVLFSAD